MKKFVILLLLLMPFVVAQQNPLTITIISIDGTNMVNVPVDYRLELGDEQPLTGRAVTDNTNSFNIEVEPGFYKLTLGVDMAETQGFDYYGSTNFYSNKSMDVDVFPVGSLRVVVVDKNEVPVDKAYVRIDCSATYGEQGYFRTDELGIVSLSFIPTEECTLRAAMEDSVTAKNIQIERGVHREETLLLEDFSQKENNLSWPIITTIILVLIAGAAYWYFGKDKNNEEINEEIVREVKKKDYSSGKKDIIRTLKGREKKIVEFILENKEKEGEDYMPKQADIVYGTGIPKTSMARILKSLEGKDILETKKVGKLKKIDFTDWFNEK